MNDLLPERLGPTVLEELSDIKTAVSEAVTNSVVHGYAESIGEICVECELFKDRVEIVVSDTGCGIDDVEKAKKPFYTSKPESERSGMGITIMESFMTTFDLQSEVGKGTTVHMRRKLQRRQ